jgi:hypothetical protein
MQTSASGKTEYACPQGYTACNDEFFKKPHGEEYVVCRKSSEEASKACPITSVKFKLASDDQ